MPETDTDTFVSRLRVVEDGTSSILPGWAIYYLKLGRAIANLPGGRPLLVSIVAPIRDYAASLLALGFVHSRLSCPPSDERIRDHISRLKRLPVSQMVKVYSRRKERIMRGYLTSLHDPLKVRVQNEERGGLSYVLPADRALEIATLDREEKRLPKSQKGFTINISVPFLQSAFPERNLSTLLVQSSLECVLIGSVSRLTTEVQDTELQIGPAKLSRGCMNDILRLRRTKNTFENFRSDIFTSRGYNLPKSIRGDEGRAKLIVFDGSRGFVRWHARFRKTHRVVIMSRADRDFSAAIAEINGYHMRKTGAPHFDNLQPLPPGVEMSLFHLR